MQISNDGFETLTRNMIYILRTGLGDLAHFMIGLQKRYIL